MIIEVKLMLKKVLTKDLINGYSIFNGVKCFVENGSLNHVVFQPVFKYFKSLQIIIWLWHRNLRFCQMKVETLIWVNGLNPRLN